MRLRRLPFAGDMRMMNRHSAIAVVVPCLALLLSIYSSDVDAQMPHDKPAYDYRHTTLDNGLQVITLEDHSCPIVSVQIWYHVGSKDEHPERQGFAHMFEHMMFRGTDRLGPTDHFELIRRTGGTTNGYTNFDSTTYLETVPSNQLELALWLEAERMALLRIDQESFDTERKVVEEERRMGLNRPFGTLMENLMAQVFQVHPYRWTPIGNIPHLRAATVPELRDFWHRYYVPNNATLVIVGDIQHEAAQQLARKYLAWIPRAPDPPRVTVREPMPAQARDVTIKEQNAPVPLVMIAYRTVPVAHEDATPLNLLGTILAGGQSSRLYRELVAQRQLAVAADTMELSLEQDGVLGLMAVLAPNGSQPDEVLDVIRGHIERVRQERVPPEELEKAKNQQLARLVTQNLTIDSKARAVGYAAVVEADVARVNRQIDDVRRVTAEDLQRVAQAYLVPDKSLVVRVPRNLLGSAVGKLRAAVGAAEDAVTEEGVSSGDEAAAAQDGDQPAVAAATAGAAATEGPLLQRPADFPHDPPLAGLLENSPRSDHVRDRLPNGLQVIVVPNHEVPFVSVELQLLAGSYTETATGAASMAMQMLDKGTQHHTEAELAEELDRYAISLSGDADNDSASLSAGCLTEHLERAVQLLAEVAQTPTFPAEEFEKLRAQVRADLEVQSAEPSYVAQRELDRQLFGQHPYSRTATGELADVDALQLSDLQQWWQQYVRPDMAVLYLAGDIDQPRAMELAQQVFGDWQAQGPRPESKLPDFPPPQSTRILLVDRPGSVQSQIRVGQLGLTRHDPAYFTSVLVSDYFGGAFDSRLNEVVRVQKGLTYGARGGFQSQRFGGAFVASTFTKTESTADAVQVVLAEIARLRKEPPTAEELKKRQTYFLGSFAMRRETPQQVAGELWLIESNGLPPDHFEAMVKAISTTSPEDCQTLAQSALDPSRLVVVVVGDAAALQTDLEKIAPVTVVKSN